MKALSALVFIQGLCYFLQSISGLLNEKPLKFGTQLINSNYHMIGVILGLWFVLNGIGLWNKKKHAVTSTIIGYSLLLIYGIISIGYILTVNSFEPTLIIPTVLIILMSIFFLAAIKYLKNWRNIS